MALALSVFRRCEALFASNENQRKPCMQASLTRKEEGVYLDRLSPCYVRHLGADFSNLLSRDIPLSFNLSNWEIKCQEEVVQ